MPTVTYTRAYCGQLRQMPRDVLNSKTQVGVWEGQQLFRVLRKTTGTQRARSISTVTTVVLSRYKLERARRGGRGWGRASSLLSVPSATSATPFFVARQHHPQYVYQSYDTNKSVYSCLYRATYLHALEKEGRFLPS